MKKILFSDMDGTILGPNGWLHPGDKDKIDELRKAGHLFVLNTGRNYEEVMRSVEQLDLSYDYLVLNNGGRIIDCSGKEIFKQIIPSQIGRDIIEHCLKYDDMKLDYYDGKKTFSYFNGKTHNYDHVGKIVVNEEIDFIKEYQNVKEFDIIAINQIDEGIDEVLKIQEYIDDNYADHAHGTLNTHYLDITPRGCTKGTGISRLIELLDSKVESYAIGDSYNDISMFEHADYGYTFNRVTDEIKQHSYKQVEYVSELIDEMLK